MVLRVAVLCVFLIVAAAVALGTLARWADRAEERRASGRARVQWVAARRSGVRGRRGAAVALRLFHRPDSAVCPPRDDRPPERHHEH